MKGEHFLLRVPDVARLLLTAGREIVVEMDPDVPLEEAAPWLTGTAFGILLQQRGRVVLHASAVRVEDKAVLFCGASGAGKSTMAAVLAQHGYAMLTDDISATDPDRSGAMTVWSDGRLLKLWMPAIRELGLLQRKSARVNARLDKHYIEEATARSEALPIGAIYELGQSDTVFVRRLAPIDGMRALRRNAYRPPLVRFMGQEATYFAAAANIAKQAGIFALERPFDMASLPEVAQALQSHWRETGLLSRTRTASVGFREQY
jgi:hypothetical protein